MRDPQFKISSYCGNQQCLAVAILDDGTIMVRDDKVVDGPVLSFPAAEWDAFITGAKDGEFDRRRLQEFQHAANQPTTLAPVLTWLSSPPL